MSEQIPKALKLAAKLPHIATFESHDSLYEAADELRRLHESNLERHEDLVRVSQMFDKSVTELRHLRESNKELLEAVTEAENALADYIPTIERTGGSLNYGHTVLRKCRAALANAFSGLAATCYASVPESPIPPAIVIVPDSPYGEIVLIGKGAVKIKLNFAISAIVASNSNAGSLDNLEKLIIGILAAMPAGYVVGQIEKPTVLEVGQSPMLVADINVSTYYTQTT